MLAPHDGTNSIARHFKVQVPREALLDHQQRLIVFGTIEYDDVYHEHHRTDFMFQTGAPSSKWLGHSFESNIPPFGNYAD